VGPRFHVNNIVEDAYGHGAGPDRGGTVGSVGSGGTVEEVEVERGSLVTAATRAKERDLDKELNCCQIFDPVNFIHGPILVHFLE